MILLADLIRLPVPTQPEPTLPFRETDIKHLEDRMKALTDLSMESGVVNAEQARRQLVRLGVLTGTIRDLQRRMQLREGLDFADVYDLRNRWKEGYRQFLRFRDTLRDSLNILVAVGKIQASASDQIKAETDDFFNQLIEVDRVVRATLARS